MREKWLRVEQRIYDRWFWNVENSVGTDNAKYAIHGSALTNSIGPGKNLTTFPKPQDDYFFCVNILSVAVYAKSRFMTVGNDHLSTSICRSRGLIKPYAIVSTSIFDSLAIIIDKDSIPFATVSTSTFDSLAIKIRIVP